MEKHPVRESLKNMQPASSLEHSCEPRSDSSSASSSMDEDARIAAEVERIVASTSLPLDSATNVFQNGDEKDELLGKFTKSAVFRRATSDGTESCTELKESERMEVAAVVSRSTPSPTEREADGGGLGAPEGAADGGGSFIFCVKKTPLISCI